MQSMCATTLASPQQGACTEWWPMRAQTSSVGMGSALWQNGSMTTCSSRSHESTYPLITPPAHNGAVKSANKEAASRMVAAYGTGGRTSQMAPQRNSMKTAISHSGTWREPPPTVQKTECFRTQMQTLMPFPRTLEFAGNPPNLFPLDQKSRIWVSVGTYTHALSASSKRKGSNTWLQLQNGRRSQCTSCPKHRSCTENSNMC